MRSDKFLLLLIVAAILAVSVRSVAASGSWERCTATTEDGVCITKPPSRTTPSARLRDLFNFPWFGWQRSSGQ
jgi:hypothetical protein